MSVDFQCYLKEDFSIGFRSLLVSCRTLLLISQRLILSFIFLSPPDRSALACLIEDSPVSFFFFCLFRCAKNRRQMSFLRRRLDYVQRSFQYILPSLALKNQHLVKFDHVLCTCSTQMIDK